MRPPQPVKASTTGPLYPPTPTIPQPIPQPTYGQGSQSQAPEAHRDDRPAQNVNKPNKTSLPPQTPVFLPSATYSPQSVQLPANRQALTATYPSQPPTQPPTQFPVGAQTYNSAPPASERRAPPVLAPPPTNLSPITSQHPGSKRINPTPFGPKGTTTVRNPTTEEATEESPKSAPVETSSQNKFIIESFGQVFQKLKSIDKINEDTNNRFQACFPKLKDNSVSQSGSDLLEKWTQAILNEDIAQAEAARRELVTNHMKDIGDKTIVAIKLSTTLFKNSLGK